MRIKCLLLCLLMALSPVGLAAAGGHGHSSGSSKSTTSHAPAKTAAGSSHTAKSAPSKQSKAFSGVARDADGRIKRSEAAKHDFMKQTGYPHGRPGYVVDHIVPLKRGGKDAPSNMQWQTKEAAKAKDKWE